MLCGVRLVAQVVEAVVAEAVVVPEAQAAQIVAEAAVVVDATVVVAAGWGGTHRAGGQPWV